ncbi:putative lipoprotein [Hyphomonas neptunium ATCC 15444]|uniref:Putative lipoprotein n=2 Tax=Hyphomonas TaxID=85 RepID=Q0C4D0_HYPNA|nr:MULTISPECIES: hypothetical protein [Hyphomonas]ABI76314.1 putative lipoprotein [Hyphomonas neptunium ATCC 15444]KCZ96374.1 putative lipoprotein [Hyphomonas hirschiana VP5]
MKSLSVLSALLLPAILGACNPAPNAPEPIVPPPHVPEVSGSATADDVPAPPAADSTLSLTTFEPTTVEIYCSFHRPSQDGVLGERLFITEIAGVPAPAAIGLEGEPVTLKEVSKTEADGAEIWTYRNDERPVEIELRLKEVEQGMEYRNYTGTIRISDPVDASAINIEGSCGV